jgi:hypothetical protein
MFFENLLSFENWRRLGNTWHIVDIVEKLVGI